MNKKSLELKDRAIKRLENLIMEYIKNNDKRGKKLSYWLLDYANYLSFEKDFKPSSLKKYKRGEIIKANLGYNVGSEEGGLHYCMVLENHNSNNSPVITVIPLTSVKENKDLTKLNKGEIYIGNYLYKTLRKKIENHTSMVNIEIEDIKNKLNNEQISELEFKALNTRTIELKKKHDTTKKMVKEISRMKPGSIILVNQITTISKMRIYDPKTKYDVLSGIKLSPNSLNSIDKAISEMFTYSKKIKKTEKHLDKCI